MYSNDIQVKMRGESNYIKMKEKLLELDSNSVQIQGALDILDSYFEDISINQFDHEKSEIHHWLLVEFAEYFSGVEGEAAFYGPKIDVQVWSAIGKEFTLATNQVDFAVPRKFGLSYKDENGKDRTPLCIHRAPLSTHERFIGFLIEHFGGDFPLWLAPVQVIILPISDKALNYSNLIYDELNSAGVRATLNNRSDKIGAKIRQIKNYGK